MHRDRARLDVHPLKRAGVAVLVLLAIAAAIGALRLRRESDLRAFLPARDSDVQQTLEVGRRFGTLKEVPPASVPAYEQAQADVLRLVPVSLGVSLIVIALLLRAPREVLAVFGCAAWATLVVAGALGYAGVRWTIALSALPVIVLGTSLLVRRASLYVALVAGSGLFAFAVTDVRPLRVLAIGSGAGVLLCWLAVGLFEHADRPVRLAWLDVALGFVARHRLAFALALAVPALFFVAPLRRVNVRTQSQLAVADELVLDVAVQGDFEQPAALRGLAAIGDYAATLPGVTQVDSVIDALVAANHGHGAGYRLPASVDQVKALYGTLPDQPLLAHDRREALVRVHVADHATQVVAALEAKARQLTARGWPTHEEASAELVLLFTRPGAPTPDKQAIERAVHDLELPGPDDTELQTLRERATLDAIMSGTAPELHASMKAKAELAVERQATGWQELWRKAAVRPLEVDATAKVLTDKLDALPRRIALERALRALTEAANTGELPESTQHRVERATDDVFAPPAPVATTELHAELAGDPILLRGFDRAVRHALQLSLVIALLAALALALLSERSIGRALLCLAPPALALVYVLGGLGMSTALVDLGASLVPSLVLGVGVAAALAYRPVQLLPLSAGLLVLGFASSPALHLFVLAGVALLLAVPFTLVLAPPRNAQPGNSQP